MRWVFCADPLEPRRPDPAFGREVEAVRALGQPWVVVDFEALTGPRARLLLRGADGAAGERCVYRGWMLRPDRYEVLREGLASRGLGLVNSTEQYRHCHHLPGWYPLAAEHTPRSIWFTPPFDRPAIHHALAREFGASPLVLKDFVKSRKHEWKEACFIPNASDSAAVDRIVDRFLELTGEDLNDGLVFRQFLALEEIGQHSRSGMPLAREFRRFFLDGEELLSARYWDEGDYAAGGPPADLFAGLARTIQSRFFSMDVAKVKDGPWVVVELGDAQVSGLPENADPASLFSAVSERLSR